MIIESVLKENTEDINKVTLPVIARQLGFGVWALKSGKEVDFTVDDLNPYIVIPDGRYGTTSFYESLNDHAIFKSMKMTEHSEQFLLSKNENFKSLFLKLLKVGNSYIEKGKAKGEEQKVKDIALKLGQDFMIGDRTMVNKIPKKGEGESASHRKSLSVINFNNISNEMKINLLAGSGSDIDAELFNDLFNTIADDNIPAGLQTTYDKLKADPRLLN